MALSSSTLRQIGSLFCVSLRQNFFTRSRSLVSAMEFREVVQRLGSIAPLSLAESWDNVGLLVGPSSPQPAVERMLLTNDLTEVVMDEALSKRVNFIYCYHPVIFSPLKQLTPSTAKERVLIKALENRIAIYCPHTALDAVNNGVNDWLASGVGPGRVLPLNQVTHNEKAITLLFDEKEKAIALEQELRQVQGVTVRGIAHKTWISTEQETSQYEMDLCCRQSAVVDIVDKAGRFCSVDDITVFQVAKAPRPLVGCGRLVILQQPVTLERLIARVKDHLSLQHVRLAVPSDSCQENLIERVAVCAGSGGKLLLGVAADVYLTGEMSHHDVLAAVGSGRAVILCEHSNTERGFLHQLQPRLQSLLDGNVLVEVSSVDADPLKVV